MQVEGVDSLGGLQLRSLQFLKKCVGLPSSGDQAGLCGISRLVDEFDEKINKASMTSL